MLTTSDLLLFIRGPCEGDHRAYAAYALMAWHLVVTRRMWQMAADNHVQDAQYYVQLWICLGSPQINQRGHAAMTGTSAVHLRHHPGHALLFLSRVSVSAVQGALVLLQRLPVHAEAPALKLRCLEGAADGSTVGSVWAIQLHPLMPHWAQSDLREQRDMSGLAMSPYALAWSLMVCC